VNVVKEAGDGLYGLKYYEEIYKGSKNSRIIKNKHDKLKGHGKGKSLPKPRIDLIARQLLTKGYLLEKLQTTTNSSYTVIQVPFSK
jgi:bloom syndrome protein